jgi:DNA-binding transcriptional ArsR family regulator
MIGAVVRRAIEHPEFRRKLLDNPQDALSSHGFALEDAELAEIDRIRTSLSGNDVEQSLVSIAEKYGVSVK